MRTGSQQVSGELERSDGLLTLHGGKVVEELIQTISGGQVVEEVLHGHPGSAEDGRASEDLWIGLHNRIERRHIAHRIPEPVWCRGQIAATGARLTSGWTRRPGVLRNRRSYMARPAGPRVSLLVSRMNAFHLNVAGWACQFVGTLFLLLDSVRVRIRLPREGVTLGDPPGIDKWYYHWASPLGFFLLLLGFALCGIALWISRARQQPIGAPPVADNQGDAEVAVGPGAAGGDANVLELGTNYWLKRLDHTLTHTQTSSRLIYLVDGAVLALVYFVIQTLGASRQVIGLMSAPTLLLTLLNGFHARLVIIQREHYLAIDSQLRQLLNQPQVQFRTPRHHLASTHGLYCAMHIVVALFLAISAVTMILYGLGWFSEIKMPRAPVGG